MEKEIAILGNVWIGRDD